MHIALWILQVLLAVAFTGAGLTKLLKPVAELAQMNMGGWVTDSPELLIRFIGLSELLGAIGLVAPSATRIMPRLTGVAAGALALVMVLAAATHLKYGEFQSLPANFMLASLAAFVAWGRLSKKPIEAKTATA